MDNDAEFKAYQSVVKNDKRQRIATYLLLLVVLLAVIASLALMVSGQKKLVADAQRDSRTRTEENRRYTTCLLILPLEKRNVEGQKYCFDKSDLPGGRSPSEFTPITVDVNDVAILNTPSAVQGLPSFESSYVSSSGSNSNPNSEEPKSENSQAQEETEEPQPNLIQRVINTIRGIL